MKISEIHSENFRNIEKVDFYPADELTVICGKNGQGKTNLLESIWLLTGSKSFRGARDIDLVKIGAEYAVVDGVTRGYDKESHIRIFTAGESCEKKGRSAKVNGVDFGRATSLAGIFTCVVFEPEHLRLIKGSPEGRRRFMDAALCQLYPSYLLLLRKYTRLLTQKNALLKGFASTQCNRELLDVFDESLAVSGSELSQKRQEYVKILAPEVSANYSDIARGRERLKLEYEPSFDSDLLKVLQNSRARDIAAGYCTTGPQREDITIFLDDKNAKIYASQGQRRSAVLSLKMAEAAAAQKITGEHPVMLLDDVLSELDDSRQSYLLTRMEHRQTIVTACDAELFKKTNGKIVRMENGVLL